MKKIMAFILTAMLFGAAASVQAATVTVKPGSTVVEAEVDLGTSNAYKMVSVTMASSNRKMVFADAALTDDKGKYTFKFNHTGKSGNYKLYFKTDDYSETVELNDFKGTEYYQPYIDAINTGIESDDISATQTAIEAYAAICSWDMSAYSSMTDKTKLYTLFVNMEKRYSGIDGIKADFETAYKLAGCIINNDSAGLYALYLEDLTSGAIGFKDALPKGKTNTVIDDLRSTVADKVFAQTLTGEINSVVDLKNALYLNALIVPIKEAEHYEDVKIVVEAYASAGKINVDTKNSNAVSVYKGMMNKSYSSATDVENGFKNTLNSVDTPKQPSSPGGGGGGGASYIPSAKPTTSEETKPEETNSEDKSEENNTPKMTFSDMEDAKWALDAVEALYKRGVISGVAEGKFAPHNAVTRAEFAQLAVKLAGYSGGSAAFKDVSGDVWYAKPVSAACENGLFVGFEDGTFGPNIAITREQIALVVYRMIADKADFGEFEIGGFADDEMIDPGFKEAVYALKALGVISGRSAHTFCPDEYVTRVEAAVLLNNISKYF